MTSRIALFCLGFVLFACGELSSNPGQDAGPGTVRVGCDAVQRCIDGLSCVVGECLLQCDSGNDACVGDHFCEGGEVCQYRTRPTCDESPCGYGQACVNDQCTVLGSECATDDACRPAGMCDPASGKCAEGVPCDIGGTCRPGRSGAVCNEGPVGQSVPDPRRSTWTCLNGRCLTDAHCPAPLHCLDVGAEAEAPSLGRCR